MKTFATVIALTVFLSVPAQLAAQQTNPNNRKELKRILEVGGPWLGGIGTIGGGCGQMECGTIAGLERRRTYAARLGMKSPFLLGIMVPTR